MLAEPRLLVHTPTHAAAHNTTQHVGCCGQQPTLAYTPCHVRQENYANLVTALPPQNSKDDGVAELTAALNAISVAVGTAAEGGPAQDVELCEVLGHLDIVPGRPAHPAAIEAVQAWAELEDQLEIVEALTKDATDVLNERGNGTFADDANPSDNELELAGTENVESEGGRRLAPPPPFSELSSLFEPLEKYAKSCGISGAAYHLRKAKMDFIHARSSKPAVQADIRAMFSDS